MSFHSENLRKKHYNIAQLTGNFIGTDSLDTFSGSINNDEQTIIDGVATGIAVKQVIIDTLVGPIPLRLTPSFLQVPSSRRMPLA